MGDTFMRIITVSMPVPMLEEIAKLVHVYYPSRSEIIRVAIRDLLIDEMGTE